MAQIADASYIPTERVQGYILAGLDAAEDRLKKQIDDHVFAFDKGRHQSTADEERSLRNSVSRSSLNESAAARLLNKLDQVAALRDIIEGNLPANPFSNTDLPIDLEESETPVWVFLNVRYFADSFNPRWKGKHQGKYLGEGDRIGRGLYFERSRFVYKAGRYIRYHEYGNEDTGTVVLTDKHVYFSGKEKSLKLAYSSLVSFDGYIDGFSIRDTPLNQERCDRFITGDGWFPYNLLANLVRRSGEAPNDETDLDETRHLQPSALPEVETRNNDIDLYEILNLHPSALPDVIEAAYRALALEYDPEMNPILRSSLVYGTDKCGVRRAEGPREEGSIRRHA